MKREWVIFQAALVLQQGAMTFVEALDKADELLKLAEQRKQKKGYAPSPEVAERNATIREQFAVGLSRSELGRLHNLAWTTVNEIVKEKENAKV